MKNMLLDTWKCRRWALKWKRRLGRIKSGTNTVREIVGELEDGHKEFTKKEQTSRLERRP